MTTLEMMVNIDCPGCQSKVKKALQKLDGVDSIDIDMILQKVTVTGSAEPDMILNTVRKTGRNADLWTSAYEFPPENDDNDSTQYFHGQYNYQINPTSYNLLSYDHQLATGSTKAYDHYYNNGDQEYEYDYENHYYDEYDRDNYHHQLLRRRPNTTMNAMFSDENVNACSVM